MTTMTALDPLRPVVHGRYEDDAVLVLAGGPPGLTAARLTDGRILVEHRLPRIDDDVTELLAAALLPLTSDHQVFARAFTGVVLTSHPSSPAEAWERFYRASLARIEDPSRGGYVEIHRHALALLPRTSVLDVGCSFGFLALHLASLGVAVTACESDVGTARLLRTMSERLALPLPVVPDLAAVPDRSVDAVALLHVLEHVDDATGIDLLEQVTRIARRRIVVAVPYENDPESLYGHVRQLDASRLAQLGERTAWETTVHDHHGGWLVLDQPPRRSPNRPNGRLFSKEGDPQ